MCRACALRATGQDIENIARTLEMMKNTDDKVGLQADLDSIWRLQALIMRAAQLIASFTAYAE